MVQLRGRRLAGAKFKRQWTIGPYVVDFCCAEAMLVVEIDGGQHDEQRDGARTQFLRSKGYHVRRFWNNDVLTNMDGVLTVLQADLGEELLKPSPVRGRGLGEGPTNQHNMSTELAKPTDPHPGPLPQAVEGDSGAW